MSYYLPCRKRVRPRSFIHDHDPPTCLFCGQNYRKINPKTNKLTVKCNRGALNPKMETKERVGVLSGSQMPAFRWAGPGRHKDARKTMMAGPPVLHPLQILFQEHAKYMVAIKELQSQVQKLQEFRSRVIQAFPQLESGPLSDMPSKTRPTSGRNEVPSRKSTSPGKAGRVLPTVSQSCGGRQRSVPKSQSLVRDRDGQSAKGAAPGGARNQLGDRPAWRNNKFVVVAQGKNWLRIRPCTEKSDSDVDDSDDEHNSTSDSLHSMTDQPATKRKTKSGPVGRKGEGGVAPRQDSGFSTDGKERLHQDRSSDINWMKLGNTAEDELMNILDLIGEKSRVLRSQADKAESQGATLSDIGLKPDDILNEMEVLRMEKEQLLERLVLAEAERDMYKAEMGRLRNSLIDTEATRRTLEDRLEIACSEREHLGSKLHHIQARFARDGRPAAESAGTKDESATQSTSGSNVRSSVGSSSSEMMQPMLGNGSNSLPNRLSQNKLKVHMDKSKISAILQETRTLELQRQLLVAVLRNEVLKTQLEQSVGDWHHKTAAWQQAEFGLRSDIDLLQQNNGDLLSKLQQTKTELRVEQSKRQVLERALHAAYKDMTVSNARGESVSSTENVRQLSVEVFPVHQIAMSHHSEKFADRSSPSTWKPVTSAGPNIASAVSSVYTPASPGTPATMTGFSYPFSRVPCNGQQDSTSTVRNDKTDWRERNVRSDARIVAAEDDVESHDTLANLYLRLREARQGNVLTSELGNAAFARSSVATQQTRRLSLNEMNALKRDRNDSKLKTNSFVTRSSPKHQSDIFIPKYSQSAEDLRNSEWEWTYDMRDTSQQFAANIPQQLTMSKATT